MKKINVHNVTESLSSKEMKAVTGGSNDASYKHCEDCFDCACSTDADCAKYGNVKCVTY